MKVVIIGPGAIGCLFAGLLTETNHNVWLLDKRKERSALIARNGIRIESANRTQTIPVKISTDPLVIDKADLIIICVKSYDTSSAIQNLPPLLHKKTLVLSMQNGLGNIQQTADMVPGEEIVAGVTTYGSTLLGVGYIRHAGTGLTTIGPLNKNCYKASVRLAQELSMAGIETVAVKDISSILWSKLLIISAIGPVSALSGLRNGEIPANKKWGPVLRKLALEVAALARAKEIHLQYKDPVKAVLEVCNRTADNVSSMLQDIKRGHQTEIDAINGAIVREAKKVGVPVPLNIEVVEAVRKQEKK